MPQATLSDLRALGRLRAKLAAWGLVRVDEKPCAGEYAVAAADADGPWTVTWQVERLDPVVVPAARAEVGARKRQSTEATREKGAGSGVHLGTGPEILSADTRKRAQCPRGQSRRPRGVSAFAPQVMRAFTRRYCRNCGRRRVFIANSCKVCGGSPSSVRVVEREARATGQDRLMPWALLRQKATP